MSRKYKFHDRQGVYFISFAVVNWMDVFIREVYFDCLIKSLAYCREKKGMELFAYFIMPSHVHLIFSSKNADPSGLLRDFKSHTSKQLGKLISENKYESRREWMLMMMKNAGNKNSNVQGLQFWQQNNHPIELYSQNVFDQKMDYIHANPIVFGFVTEAAHWKYSSARNYENNDHSVLEIDFEWL